MLICIDSSVFIPGLEDAASPSGQLLDLLGQTLQLVIPRLIAQEVSRNLSTTDQVRHFYHLFRGYQFAVIVDEPIPPHLVQKYSQLGLPEKADAFIGAFAEWQNVQYLISENRHFLRDLQTDAFEILTPTEFITIWLNQ